MKTRTFTHYLSVFVLIAVALSTLPSQAAGVAYHDILGTDDSGPVTNTSGQTSATATTELVQFSDGTGTGADLTTGGGNYNGATGRVRAPNSSTDAYTLFNPSGIDLTDGEIDFSNPVYFTFSDLDPNLSYGVALYGDRIGSAVDTTFKLIGANSQTNISSTGTIDDTFNTSFSTRGNAIPGYLARWTDIDVGADGSIRLDVDANFGYLTAVYLEELGSAAENSPVENVEGQNFNGITVGTTDHTSAGDADWGFQTTVGDSFGGVVDLSGDNAYRVTGGAVTLDFDTIDLSTFINAEVSFDWLAPGNPFEGGDYLILTATLEGPDGTSVIEFFNADPGVLDASSTFETSTWSIPDSATSLSLVVTAATSDPSGEFIYLDNFLVTGASTIPEPSTAILAGLGLMGVCFRRRRC